VTDTRRDAGPWSCSSDGTDDGTRLIARRYLDHKFVITSLIHRNSVHIEKKVVYTKYANVRNKFTNTPNESILKLKKK